jgi:hypothetical protein
MRSIGLLVALGALICVSVAAAKDFRPGDLRLCGPARCVAVTDRGALRELSSFIYGTRRVTIVRSPRVGAPAYELRFKNGYVAGMVGTSRVDRFRSQGVICGRFRTGKWYRLPARAARTLRTLAAPIEPLRVSSAVPRSC